MFKITKGRGFHITFQNGYTVSVQFGPANYCENYDRKVGKDDIDCGSDGSRNAECAVWDKSGELIEHPYFGGGSVGGYMSPEDVLRLMKWAEEQ